MAVAAPAQRQRPQHDHYSDLLSWVPGRELQLPPLTFRQLFLPGNTAGGTRSMPRRWDSYPKRTYSIPGKAEFCCPLGPRSRLQAS